MTIYMAQPGPGGRAQPGLGGRAAGSQVPRIAGLPPEPSRALIDAATPMRRARGEVIFALDDPGDSMFLIVHGKVRMGRPAGGGKEHLLTLLGPGDLFGELTMFDPAPRKATARALTDVDLRCIDSAAMRRWLSTEPDAAWHLLRFLARRLRRVNDVVENLLYSDVPRRVARVLLEMADHFGQRISDGVRVHHDLTQEQLAHHVGASRESVNRALGDLADRGVIRMESRSVVIVDLDRLRRKASSG
ncbi:Crp/Fnr family transcriptional regulator [Actinomadura sp. 1N219]|uniref:Crp/Fnr family transcriptional regulator n=1 Tax=Actinomadura sp. 1N219 TaxID=3375152 RepID=UPI003794933A